MNFWLRYHTGSAALVTRRFDTAADAQCYGDWLLVFPSIARSYVVVERRSGMEDRVVATGRAPARAGQ